MVCITVALSIHVIYIAIEHVILYYLSIITQHATVDVCTFCTYYIYIIYYTGIHNIVFI